MILTKAEYESMLAEAKKLRRLLRELRAGCWCEMGIGNPMVSRHTDTCEEIQKLFAES